DCDTIVFEDLSEIRSRISNGKKFQQWAFRRLFQYVEYKAEGEGLTVEQIDPAYTSQRCSKCGTTLEENRDGNAFQCLKCGYELHADYNAAKNIGMKYVRRGPTSRAGRASSHLALKSGTVNGNGRYSPASSEA
ncbi:MAG: RNA-guided endonuclease InsQ/TnpB family protein, partial [Halobacteriales archaeon]